MPDSATPERDAYVWALKVSAVALAVVAGGAAAVGWVLAASAGLLSGLAGVALAALTGLLTQAAMLWAHRKDANTFAAIVGGAWLGKMLVIVLVVAALSRLEGLHRGTFGLAILLGVGATMVIDVLAVKKARQPYVDKSTGDGQS